MERVKGIEPSCTAWKAVALPLSYTRKKPFRGTEIRTQNKSSQRTRDSRFTMPRAIFFLYHLSVLESKQFFGFYQSFNMYYIPTRQIP